MAPSGSGWRRLRVWIRNVDRKEAKSAAWIVEGVSCAGYSQGKRTKTRMTSSSSCHSRSRSSSSIAVLPR